MTLRGTETLDESTPILTRAAASARLISARSWADIAVMSVLSIIGILGLQTAFGDFNFLLAGAGGLIVGTGAAVLGVLLRQSVLITVLAAILAYFVFGTPFTMPSEGIAVVIPSLSSLAGLVFGAVFGWADIVTLFTPVEAPYYMAALPYFAVWLVALIGTSLALRWLPRHRRTVWRASVLLIGPVLLYLSGILLGTDEPFLAAVRGTAFAAIALVWLGWRPSQAAKVTALGSNKLLRRKVVGTAVLVVGAVTIGAVAGSIIAPMQQNRFVLREEITPPFDPSQFASPLAGFRHFTKAVAEDQLFTVSGLKPGDVIRLASMDSYDGKLWLVSGPAAATSASGSFSLVGKTLPYDDFYAAGRTENLSFEISGLDDFWLPMAGHPTSLDFVDEVSSANSESLRYNPTSATGVLTNGIRDGYRYTLTTVMPAALGSGELENLPVAQLTRPPVQNTPDIVTAKATELAADAATPFLQLTNIANGLKGGGFLSHGLASDQAPSRAGHGADRMSELFTRTQMIGDQEQYASAMALMANSLGYPARVVMGFAPEVADGSTSVTVVGDDVTAWVEVAFEDVGWVPFFPTPDETDVPQDQTPKPKTEPQPQVRQPPRSENQDDGLLTAVEIDESDKDEKDRPFVLPGWVWVLGGVLGIPLILIFGPMLVIALLKRRRRRRRLAAERGDTRVAGAWDELTDGYAELGFEVPRMTTRRGVAEALEAQLAEQSVGEATPVRTDTGPIAVPIAGGTLSTAVASATTIRLQPIAASVDRAVFNGEAIDQDVVEHNWARVDESLLIARGAVGRMRRFIARYRLRATRDWKNVNLNGKKS